ncbi:hypothetical protein GCM10027290_66430 [Micromonospora sonneratiae]
MQDALLRLLLPLWQVVIGVLVLLAVVVSVQRLARRGHSRMTTIMLMTAAAIVGLAVFGLLVQP